MVANYPYLPNSRQTGAKLLVFVILSQTDAIFFDASLFFSFFICISRLEMAVTRTFLLFYCIIAPNKQRKPHCDLAQNHRGPDTVLEM